MLRRKPSRLINRNLSSRKLNRVKFDKIQEEIEHLSNIAYLLKEEFNKPEGEVVNFRPLIRSNELN